MKRKPPDGATDAVSGVQDAPEAHPTALVAVRSGELRQPLVDSLRRDNWLVLEADSLNGVLDVVKLHSRPIQVLLLDVNIGDPALAARLKHYRFGMQVLSVTARPNESQSALPPDGVLAIAREFKPRKKGAGEES
jgi:hypothetical protein